MNISKFVEKIKDTVNSLDLQLISKILVAVVVIAVFSSYITAQNIKRDELQKKNEELEQKYSSDNNSNNISANAAQAEEVVVHIKGEVKNPAVYTLTNRDRIEDAIEKAGGVTENADINSVNLSEKLYDSEEIIIPKKTSEQDKNASIKKSTSSQTAPVNINTATKEQLMTLSGIGESYAQKIIEYRSKSGGFKSKEEIMQVKGIGPSRYNDIKDKIVI